MKKLLAVLVAAMLVIMGTVALAEGGTTLTIACWDLTTTPYYEAIKTAYEAANPDVTIEWVDLASPGLRGEDLHHAGRRRHHPTCMRSRSCPTCRTGPRKARRQPGRAASPLTVWT